MQCRSCSINERVLVAGCQNVSCFRCSYNILVAEQDVGEAFNRAKLFNAGFQELKVRLVVFYSWIALRLAHYISPLWSLKIYLTKTAVTKQGGYNFNAKG